MNKELQKRILSSIILIPIALFFIIKGSIFFNFFVIVMLFITLYEWHFLSLKKSYYFPGFAFVFFSFYTFYYYGNESDYRIYFFLILLTCIATDIGGYVFGKLLKGPKLTKISPNKTYSGMIGGYLLSLIFLSYFMNFINHTVDIKWFIATIIISTVSQIGDIIISYFKRLSKVKDTGKIIPGHGGLLDRIDGMIFAFPIFYLINLTGHLS